MNLINQSVNHIIFGRGKISELDDGVVFVQFATQTKKFVFPDAFKNYLTLTDSKCRQYVAKLLKDDEQRRVLKKVNELRQIEKIKRLNNLPVRLKSQAAFGFIENDRQQVLSSGRVFLGNYCSGENRGKPRKALRIYPNSACLLTWREKNEPEESRTIWGVFMTNEDFVGCDCVDGMIPAHEKYRIVLDDQQSKSLKFWDYFDHETLDKSAKWGSVEVKYFSNTTMLRILKDILDTISDIQQKKLCKEFIDYFCRLNKI